jgi:hypothetical protein
MSAITNSLWLAGAGTAVIGGGAVLAGFGRGTGYETRTNIQGYKVDVPTSTWHYPTGMVVGGAGAIIVGVAAASVVPQRVGTGAFFGGFVL